MTTQACDTVPGAPVAHSEEQWPFKPRVPGSKPGGGTTSLPLRIRRKIRFELTADCSVPGPCWVWIGSRHKKGYGQAYFDHKKWSAHRLIYTLLVGPIPTDLQIDHLCRNRACCRPDHLEPVTAAVNQARGSRAKQTHCKRGHPLSGHNLIVKDDPSCGKRQCRTCMYQSIKRYQRGRTKAAA